MAEIVKENKMGVMPMNKLLISMSLPMMASMLIQALYNIVDSIFVSYITNLNDFPLTAVSLAFPAQNLMIAVAVGTGVGINALLSRYLGAKDKEGVNKIAQTGVFLYFVSYLLFAVFGIFAVRPFFEIQTTNPQIIEYGVSYLRICMIGSLGLCYQILYERFLQSTGKTVFSMYCQGLGAIVNIIFDPVFIFVFKLGVAGAAYATILGQFASMFLAIFLHHKYNKEINLDYKKVLKPKLKTIGKIYAIALPSIIMQSVGSLMVFLFNKILLIFTETATAVFGVYFKLQSFVFMPIFGLNNGTVPVISYNYGAGKRERILSAIKLALVYALVIMVFGLVVIQLFPNSMLAMFNASNDMKNMGVIALRIISLHFPLAAIGIVLSSSFQALGKATYSMLLSLARQLVVLIPAAYLLSFTGNVNLIWWAFPIAEVAAVTLAVIFYAYIYRKIIKKI